MQVGKIMSEIDIGDDVTIGNGSDTYKVESITKGRNSSCTLEMALGNGRRLTVSIYDYEDIVKPKRQLKKAPPKDIYVVVFSDTEHGWMVAETPETQSSLEQARRRERDVFSKRNKKTRIARLVFMDE